jgi:hypothetical protein
MVIFDVAINVDVYHYYVVEEDCLINDFALLLKKEGK